MNAKKRKKGGEKNKVQSRRKVRYDDKVRGPFIVRESSASYGESDSPQSVIRQKGQKKFYSVVSLFSGCGGLDLGFVGNFEFLGKRYALNDFRVIWANDIDEPSCQTFANYFKHDVVCGDITQILDGKFATRLFDQPIPKNTDIVLGGFPCQDFSHAGKRKGFNSKRGLLYQSMAEVVRRTKPLVFVAENVRGLLTMNGGEAIQTTI